MTGRMQMYSREYVERVVALYERLGGVQTARELDLDPENVKYIVKTARRVYGMSVATPATVQARYASEGDRMTRQRASRRARYERNRDELRAMHRDPRVAAGASCKRTDLWSVEHDQALLDADAKAKRAHRRIRWDPVVHATGRTKKACEARLFVLLGKRPIPDALKVRRMRALVVRKNTMDSRGLMELLALALPRKKAA